MKNLYSGTHHGGFQFLLILDLWGIRFHSVIVFGLGKSLLFKSVLGHCESMATFLFNWGNNEPISFKTALKTIWQTFLTYYYHIYFANHFLLASLLQWLVCKICNHSTQKDFFHKCLIHTENILIHWSLGKTSFWARILLSAAIGKRK